MYEIIVWEEQKNYDENGQGTRIIYLTVSDGNTTYLVITNEVPYGQDPQTFLDAHETTVWNRAQTEGISGDLFDLLPLIPRFQMDALIALALETWQQFNYLRGVIRAIHANNPSVVEACQDIPLETMKTALLNRIKSL